MTLVPVLMGYLIRGRIPAEDANPLNRWLSAAYRPAIDWTLRRPKTVLLLALIAFATTAWPLTRLGGEFMPPMDEGDLLYMPSALPGLSAAKASRAAAADRPPDQDRAGGGDRVRQGRPRGERHRSRRRWRCSRPPSSSSRATNGGPGMTPEKLVEELDRAVKVPGLANVWVPPIRNRIDMLATGIKSPIGVKVSGSDLAELDRIAR